MTARCRGRRSHQLRGSAWAVVLFAVAGCAPDAPGEVEVPAADPTRFAEAAYPVLLSNCGFPACHGDPRRPFAVLGPGRTRLDSLLDPYAPATAEELAFSYTRARSMLISPDGPRRAPLLRKPLSPEAGGAEHAGDDPWGKPIFASKRDPRYVALFYWAIGEPWDEAEGSEP